MTAASNGSLIGKPNPYPFLSIKPFVECAEEWLPLLEKDERLNIVYMEKLDGSNTAVSSDGMACSRRLVLLDGPSVPTKGKKMANFMGFELDFILPYVEKVQRMYETEIRQWFPPKDEVVAVCYGELIVPGTSFSKEDVFNYQMRGGESKTPNREKNQMFLRGKIYSYSVGLHFKTLISVEEYKEKIEKLRKKGYEPYYNSSMSHIGTEFDKIIYLLMNDKLKDLLDQFKFNTYKHNHDYLLNTISKLRNDLLKPNMVEGYILLIPKLSLIYKLKGAYDTFSDSRLKKIDVVVEKLKDKAEKQPNFKDLADLFSDICQASKDTKTSKKIEKAIDSAMSKFPRLQDLVDGDEKLEETKKILVNVLLKEINDSEDLEMAPKETLSNLTERIASMLTSDSSAEKTTKEGLGSPQN
ncbi:uncharacterized protein LOC131879721 isoform X2 [Tigriopus californicus]|nr:uncharacterized protein LOC131879721 isoform X2 [Tigriopus californicus]XP_059082109.1 uncharacterized protein LOC131879721 isoform X2 [Tigriopus californicus]XP_059082115.1 uncharacterized protein LOC131879721 isoform X2 [Tigriopus californicus]XP_059082122.1 uncharacterized protein LOC131879721 isoform X2 [Tigriopus californicus]